MRLPGKDDYWSQRDFDALTIQTCFGCKKKLEAFIRLTLCPNCKEEMYENLGRKIDPTYDPAAMNTWERCEQALSRLYGRLT